MTPRDASNDIKNLAYALNFKPQQTTVPILPKPAKTGKWKELRTHAVKHGFKVR